MPCYGRHPSWVGCGEDIGENDRACSVQSDDELAGGLDPDDEMGMPQEYMEDHEPNKRARMIVKSKATPGPRVSVTLTISRARYGDALWFQLESNVHARASCSNHSPRSDTDARGFLWVTMWMKKDNGNW